MERWVRTYETKRTRHYKQPREFNQSWHSSKYPIESMDWRDLQRLYLPEINQNWGQACSSLRKLWKSYKIAGRNGEPRSWQAWNIRKIQSAMGIEKSNFQELEGDQGLTDEEIEAKREEQDLNFGTNSEDTDGDFTKRRDRVRKRE